MSVFEYNRLKLKGGAALALGSFDGLHKGHRSVLEKAKSAAAEMNLTPAVMLFDVHPKALLGEGAPPALISAEKRKSILTEMGFEIIEASFSSVMDLEAGEFLALLKDEIDLRALCCGFNFHFGKRAKGDVEFLRESCRKSGTALFVTPPVFLDETLVSSTNIRRLIENGEIKKANKMLGRLFSFSSPVIEGDRRGRVLGFPTANQLVDPKLICPKRGVYASMVILNGKRMPAATNIGVRPTFKKSVLLSETNIFDFSGDLYGRELEVFLIDFIRPEADFADARSLLNRIQRDVSLAKTIYTKEFESDENP